MSTITPTLTWLPDPGDKKGVLYVWTLANGDVGAPLTNIFLDAADHSVQVESTFGAGGTVVLEGSNDGVNYHTLTDPFSNLASFTSAGLKHITEAVVYLRPRCTSGDGTTSLVVSFVGRKCYR